MQGPRSLHGPEYNIHITHTFEVGIRCASLAESLDVVPLHDIEPVLMAAVTIRFQRFVSHLMMLSDSKTPLVILCLAPLHRRFLR